MLELLVGLLVGMLFRDLVLSLVGHIHDLIVGLKNDIVSIKDRLLILLHLKDKPVVVVPVSVVASESKVS